MDLQSPKARLIAFYLPQFHPIPENDEWWGKGFTEWTNVAKAKPLYPGHYQPHIPADLGFYDLRVPETRQAQAEMAKNYGIEGFCYWHYWFAGKRLLERPFNEVLKSGEPNFPFCLGWANETWSGIWHGSPDKILMAQTYPGLSDYEAHFYTVLEAFSDPRYIKIDGKPLFIIYRPKKLPEPKLFTDYWRELAMKSGLKGLYFMGVVFDPSWVPELNGFDASIIINPDFSRAVSPKLIAPQFFPKSTIFDKYYTKINSVLTKKIPKINRKVPIVCAYAEGIKNAFLKQAVTFEHYPCIFPNWDNTPRSGVNGVVFHDSTPELFRIHLKEALSKVENNAREKRIIFIRSWNEWAEGNYLEPDKKFGKSYLEVIKDEVL
ncbi:glycoside hydrolase family 99-like domain-containing protein [Planktothrix sp. FACHB-1355]|uniref:Glycoside hydrolase family 99-like domain-containing protein n=1 Tax=Aerosakkonema funiforme FACHB-1375 TaxID=2949571 RepID=A0A926ZJ01_9CYAN|nr:MULTISPECIES: glycoside hydrolase family 99-like domain-containing protein [Oscillatoriales]MBD2182346.1 glycoside hydrolase family 99-like domain-containing protein [Aerosakkonema funiforme FACHB-1375]MBD3562032.1 glycoside hydrolase family 99-like domain-containing protein [Planktothrix sp. FACHB-1355]